MKHNVVGAATLLFITLLLAGCGSSRRAMVSGYSDEMLNRKRILLLLPEDNDLLLNNSAAYASSRGVATESARETFAGEIRASLAPSINSRLDSNTVLNYRDLPASGIVPLNATGDFPGGAPKSWEQVTRAAHEGNIDYLLVLN